MANDVSIFLVLESLFMAGLSMKFSALGVGGMEYWNGILHILQFVAYLVVKHFQVKGYAGSQMLPVS